MRDVRDDTGGIEGLPLHLMILVVIAGLTMVAVLGWVVSIPAPAVIKSVSTDPTTVNLGDVPDDEPAARTVSIRVTAYDAKDAPIKGAVVSLGGALVRTIVAEDGGDGSMDGTVTFEEVEVRLPPGVVVGELTFTIQRSGYPSKMWTIPVVRGA